LWVFWYVCFDQWRLWIYIHINTRFIHVNLCHTNVIVAPTFIIANNDVSPVLIVCTQISVPEYITVEKFESKISPIDSQIFKLRCVLQYLWQCVVLCCSALQCWFQWVVVCCRVCYRVRCSDMQWLAVCCSVLHRVCVWEGERKRVRVRVCVIEDCVCVCMWTLVRKKGGRSWNLTGFFCGKSPIWYDLSLSLFLHRSTSISISMYICIYIYTYMNIYIHMCVYLYRYIHTLMYKDARCDLVRGQFDVFVVCDNFLLLHK